MNHHAGRRAVLIALVIGAGVAVLTPAALGAASNDPTFNNTVVSVEGPSGNVLMPMWQAVPKAFGTVTVVDSKGQRVRMSQKSVGVQSLAAFKKANVAVNWIYYPAFHAPYISSIARLPGKGANGWYFRVNGIAFAKPASNVNLGRGDRVVWAFGQEKQAALDITAPGGIEPGAVVGPGAFTATITQVATKGARTAAAGATVTYGTQSGRTGADGTITFTSAPGINALRATKAGMVASTRNLCTKGTSSECPAS